MNAQKPPGNVKVTREDWLDLAMDVLVSDGVDRIKVQNLAARLMVSRSSFYWYFGSRRQLLETLLDRWKAKNTAGLVAQAEMPARSITHAVCNVQRCVVNSDLFNTELDFAVRDWARRSAEVRELVDQSDAVRLSALAAMFVRFGFDPTEGKARARVLYFMQLGYDFAQLGEVPEARLAMVPHYLQVFTGCTPAAEDVAEFTAYANSFWNPMTQEAKCPTRQTP